MSREPAVPAFACGIIRRLESAGFEAWLVGGCVRDMLRGEEPHDYDITSSARPEDVTELFAKTAPTGVRYGTVTVFSGGGRAEVTSFRGESGYTDGRRPDRVRFGGGLTDDLARRDFTVNAMALHPGRGLRDPFGGRADLRAGVIRAVGDPARRFGEDALRILRAYRFAAKLGFAIEPATLAAARAGMPLTARLSGERIRSEMEAILLGPRPSAALALVQDGLFAAQGFTARVSAAQNGMLERCPATPRVRWAAFFTLTGLPLPETCRRLRFDNATRRDAAALAEELRREPPRTAADMRRRLQKLPPESFADYLRVDAALTGRDHSARLRQLDGILRRGDACSLPQLKINGGDLRAAGIPPGPEYARILGRLLDWVAEDPARNRKDILLARVPSLRRGGRVSGSSPF